jgi:hypothetical protein
MESEFTCLELYHALKAEWAEADRHWEYFIRSLDLGVECIDLNKDIYRIVDSKKWFLTKLKYGI